jgi:hypothetical protein
MAELADAPDLGSGAREKRAWGFDSPFSHACQDEIVRAIP